MSLPWGRINSENWKKFVRGNIDFCSVTFGVMGGASSAPLLIYFFFKVAEYLWILLCFVCHGKFTILLLYFSLFAKSQIKSHGLLSNTFMDVKTLWFYKSSKITKSHALRYLAFLSHFYKYTMWFFKISKITLLIIIPISVILACFKNHSKNFYKSLSYAVCKVWCDFVIFR